MMDINPVTENIVDFKEEERPPSEQLVELHIYLVPKEKWLEKRKLAKNQAVDHTISVGFVRVLPHTHLSDLRKEMNRQLGIETVPQNFVFLRSVGRNFTQVRPRQEMEMKVKNFMPPFAPDPELYLKEGPYTGPNTWSQGEDSGLEESLADSNSQRSQDRATPESLNDDPVPPKDPIDLLSVPPKDPIDLLSVPPGPEVDDTGGRATRPPMMAISMATNEATTGLTRGRRLGGPGIHKAVKPSRGTEGLRRGFGSRNRSIESGVNLDYRDGVNDFETRAADVGPKLRAGGLNRRQNRGSSRERGGSQLPTWAETRTTRLRRSRALGEDKANTTNSSNNHSSNNSIVTANHNSNNYVHHAATQYVGDADDAEDEDDSSGRYFLERVKESSSRMRSRLPIHGRQHVSDTGAGAGGKTRGSLEEEEEAFQHHVESKFKGGYNGVYTMHARRNLRGGAGVYDDNGSKERHRGMSDGVVIENTSIKLIDEDGKDADEDVEDLVKYMRGDEIKESTDAPEIVHLHMLSVDGEDARDKAEDENLEYISSVPEVEDERGEESADEAEKLFQSKEQSDEEKQDGEDNEKEDGDETKDGYLDKEDEKENQLEQTASDTNTQDGDDGEKGDEEEDTGEVEGTGAQLEDNEASAEANDLEENNETEGVGNEEGDAREREENGSREAGEETLTSDLEEGQLVNRNGKLTIEVELKELGNDDSSTTLTPPTAAVESNEVSDRLMVQDGGLQDVNLYENFRGYSEENLLSSVDPSVPSSERRRYKKSSSKSGRSGAVAARSGLERQIKPHYPRGIYLRRMEQRDQSSNIRRTRSDGNGLASGHPSVDPIRAPNLRSSSRNRRNGLSSAAKWSTTSSTGDLRETAWDYVAEKERLLMLLDKIRSESRIREKQREELLRRIKQLQSRAHQRREQGEDHNRSTSSLPFLATYQDVTAVREMWRKRYLEAKKVTPRLEEECSRLRQELEKLHRELLAKVQAGVWALLTISGKTERPSNKLSYKIMIARLLQEIEDLTRRVEGTRLKLHTEVKLRAMAEKDVRNLREELLKKKIQVTLTRNQEQAAMGNGIRQQYFISAV